MVITRTRVGNILTRTSGYLKTVTSHSLQPYRGCSLGRSLCGVGCYVQHNRYVTAGRPWGEFLEVRSNAAESYTRNYGRERRWARRCRGGFTIFFSSATEPFLPQEFQYGATRGVLEAMLEHPPDGVILQTHSHRVTDYLELYLRLQHLCRMRFHISIETDRETLQGLPPHASSVEQRMQAARRLKMAGLTTVITVSPLLPIENPRYFFQRIADCADAVVIDHFIGGDGTASGWKTKRTPLPAAMASISKESAELSYRDLMVETAQQSLPGRVGVSIDGFAGRWMGL